MRPRTRLAIVAAAGLLISGLARAQDAPASPPASVPAASAPLLSTGTRLPPGLTPQPMQMSGMPLQVGDLPPGTVVIRVIRQTFDDNVVNQEVQLRVEKSGRLINVMTSADGRAQFSGLSIGDLVSAQTVVDGELLQSQSFELPARGGVRVVLVAGIGAGQPPGAPGQLPARIAAASASALPAGLLSGGTTATRSTPRTLVVWAMLGVFVLVAVVVLTPRKTLDGLVTSITSRRAAGRDVASSAPDRVASAHEESENPRMQPNSMPERRAMRRSDAFEELVRLERGHADKDGSVGNYATRREALMAELVSLDMALDAESVHAKAG